MTESLRVRPFRSSELEVVIDLWRACDLVVPWNDPYEDIDRKLAFQPELFLVAERAERVVGTVMAGWEGHRGWLNYLAVDPTVRRAGIGRSLVREAEARLAAVGCPKVNLQIRSANRNVMAFYRSIGYAVDDVVSMGKRF